MTGPMVPLTQKRGRAQTRNSRRNGLKGEIRDEGGAEGRAGHG